MYGCGKCSRSIGGMDEYIHCDGCCGKAYHKDCTTLNSFDVRRCAENENVLWMCDDCLRSFQKQRTKPNDEKDEEVNKPTDNQSCIEYTVGQLQAEVSEIKQCIAGLLDSTDRNQSHSATNSMPITSTPQSFPSERNATICRNNRSRLLIGSRQRSEQNISPGKFWIFFTKVAKHVRSEVIQEMVSRSLNLPEEPEVVKLVPRWGSSEDWRFVSFKVGVDWRYKQMALAETTWPAGLLFREFVRYGSSYWEP